MGNNTKAPITIDGVEYEIDSFDDNQKSLINHIMDLDRKVNAARFNLDQLQVGREAFFQMLKQSLAK